jgi:hypothetical protein
MSVIVGTTRDGLDVRVVRSTVEPDRVFVAGKERNVRRDVMRDGRTRHYICDDGTLTWNPDCAPAWFRFDGRQVPADEQVRQARARGAEADAI